MSNSNYIVGLMSPDGQFQGFLKSISTYYGKVEPTASKNCAKTYTKVENAAKDGELVSILTHGGILYNVVDKRTL